MMRAGSLKILALAGLMAVVLSMPAAPAEAGRKDKEACADVKAKIREIQDRMRSGYTNQQGRRYEAQLRKLRDKRRRVC